MLFSTIIFDWGGVFCSPGNPYSHPRLQERAGKSANEIARLPEMKALSEPYYRGQITAKQFWRGVLSLLGITGMNEEELTAAYLDSYTLSPEMLDWPVRLRQHYRVGLLSNLTNEMMGHVLKEHHLRARFDELVFSNEVGLVKPDREIYKLIMQRMNTCPEECIFVDDSQENIAAAETLGMKGIHFLSPEQFEEELGKVIATP